MPSHTHRVQLQTHVVRTHRVGYWYFRLPSNTTTRNEKPKFTYKILVCHYRTRCINSSRCFELASWQLFADVPRAKRQTKNFSVPNILKCIQSRFSSANRWSLPCFRFRLGFGYAVAFAMKRRHEKKAKVWRITVVANSFYSVHFIFMYFLSERM